MSWTWLCECGYSSQRRGSSMAEKSSWYSFEKSLTLHRYRTCLCGLVSQIVKIPCPLWQFFIFIFFGATSLIPNNQGQLLPCSYSLHGKLINMVIGQWCRECSTVIKPSVSYCNPGKTCRLQNKTLTSQTANRFSIKSTIPTAIGSLYYQEIWFAIHLPISVAIASYFTELRVW